MATVSSTGGWRRIHRVLFWLALAVWGCLFAISVRAALLSLAVPPVQVDIRGEVPVAVGFHDWSSAEHSGLRVGDRLLRVGDRDLRGAGPIDLHVRFEQPPRADGTLEVLVERDGRELSLAVPVVTTGWLIWPFLPVSLGFALAALALMYRAPPSPFVGAATVAFLADAFVFTRPLGPHLWMRIVSITFLTGAATLQLPLTLRALQLFPSGRLPRSRLARSLPWVFLPYGVLGTSYVFGVPFSHRVGSSVLALGLVFFLTLAAVLARAYRRGDALARRQMRVLLYGSYLGILPPVVGAALAIADPRFGMLAWIPNASLALIPVAFFVAVVRYDFLDIDRLITATASYNLLIVLGLGLLLTVAPWVAAALAALTGLDASNVQLATALGLAACLVPAHRRLRPHIEQLMFRERHAIDAGLEALREALPACVTPKDLFETLGRRLDAVLRPESTAIHARDGDGFAAIFVSGRGVPAALEGDGPVIATLRRCRGSLSVDGASETDPFERAALAALNASVITPVLGPDRSIEAVVALGPKRSGDVYTPGEIRALGALADRAAFDLQRFDHQEVAREAQVMQEALRRYVPGAVAEQLGRGTSLESAERDVTVLFVDIRGYTSLSEGRRAEEIFSTVNRYTERVSRIVRAAGGSVVEFNGDGMMAVFGAPDALVEKERAAVRAGRAIIEEVGTLELDGRTLSVGVGVASGTAYVGNIQAADRLIWSAIGNTTNLAARLQVMTRELGAAMVIDTATFEALDGGGRDFVCHEQVRIRGRSASADVFALPVEESAGRV